MKESLYKRIKHAVVPSEENDFHPRFFHAEIFAVFLTLAIVLQIFAYSGLGSRIISAFPALSNIGAVLPGLLATQTNEYRVAQSVMPLRQNAQLSEAARMKAEDMLKRGYFSHLDPDGQKPWKWLDAVGYDYTYAGENLAVDFIDSQDVTDAWINSSTHRKNLTNQSFTELGIGTASGVFENKQTTFVVQLFAAPSYAQKPAAPATVSALVNNNKPGIAPSTRTTAKTAATASATIASTSTIIVATDNSTASGTGTTSGQVLGLASAAPTLSTPSVSPAGPVEGFFGQMLYSSKRISISTLELLIMFIICVLIFSLTYSIVHHPAITVIEKIRRAFLGHKKAFMHSFVFIAMLCVVLILFTYFAHSPVRI